MKSPYHKHSPGTKRNKQQKAQQVSSSALEEIRALGEELQQVRQELAATKTERDSWKREHDTKYNAYRNEIQLHQQTCTRMQKRVLKGYVRGFLLGAIAACILIKVGFLILK